MMGPGMMDRHQFERMCSPRTVGFAEWRLDQLEKVVKPTAAQRAKFDEFKAASNKATEAMRAACPTDVPTTMVGRMEAMEKRFDAMLQAVRTVRPRLKRSMRRSVTSRKQVSTLAGTANGSGTGATAGSGQGLRSSRNSVCCPSRR